MAVCPRLGRPRSLVAPTPGQGGQGEVPRCQGRGGLERGGASGQAPVASELGIMREAPLPGVLRKHVPRKYHDCLGIRRNSEAFIGMYRSSQELLLLPMVALGG